MPGPARPLVATKAFTCASQHYEAGDVVDNPLVLAAVRPHGDTFIKAEAPAKAPTEDPTPKTPKEGA